MTTNKNREINYTLPIDGLLLIGPTGAGKSPLGNFIANQGFLGRTAHHLDFGSELRSLVAGNGATGSYSAEELDFIKGVLERGLLLENEHFVLAKKIISAFLTRVGFSNNHILILNGIPRHAGQAGDISSIARIHALVLLDCRVDDVYCRLTTNVGGDRTERVDDEKGLVAKKLSVFKDRTAPLIDYYTQAGSMIYQICITGTTTTEQAYNQLSALAAAHPPVALVTEPPQ